MKITVIGIGQSLRGDDAAGLEAVRVWQNRYPASASQVAVQTCELPGLALLDLLQGMEAAILVDALHTCTCGTGAGSPATPGHLFRLGPDELESFTSDTQSAHGWGVAETLSLGRSLYPALANCRITLIGIAGSQFGMGAALSPQVQAGLVEAAKALEEEIQKLINPIK